MSSQCHVKGAVSQVSLNHFIAARLIVVAALIRSQPLGQRDLILVAVDGRPRGS
jgi:hypothetical protein